MMAPSFFSRFFNRFRASQPNSTHAPKITFGIGSVVAQRYRLDAEVGRGGMGIVYRAHDLPNQRDVAIKVINVSAASARTRTDFLREAQITAGLKHPNIVKVYETGEVNTGASTLSPFIVMEYIAGKSLDETHNLTYAQIIDLAQQVCDALDYAHTQGLVHRDLKPGNILLEKRAYGFLAKLMDFGLARPRGAVDMNQANIAGTVYYVAPEVIEGKPADVGADLYALGVMLYEMVTGRVPFSDFDTESIFTQHLKDTVIPPSHSRIDVPPALEAIILRLLAKDPHDRYASAKDVRAALAQIAASPERTAARPQASTPNFATGFIGRRDEIAQVKQLLEANRLVTLTGADGIGKTRLALATGDDLTEQFSDGVWLVEFTSWRDPAMVPQVVASALGVREEARRTLMVSLTEFLSGKNLLLILDDCSHLIGACAQLAETLLQSTPVRLLATSRQPLGLASEKQFDVPTLSNNDALHLLRERAGKARLDLADAPIAARMCQRLGNLPLAVELVAARAKIFPLSELDEQLKRLGLDDETPLLHEQTIRTTMAWAHASLTEPGRVLFRRLGVFVGRFDLASIESFGGTATIDTMRLLTQLTDASLVQLDPSLGGDARYAMPEPIRQAALDKLHAAGEEEIARRNHRDGYFMLALNAERHLHTSEQAVWFRRLEIDYANVLAALDWTMARPQDASIAYRFGAALWQFWSERNNWRDGRNWLERILQLPHTIADAPARSKSLIGAGYLSVLQSDYVSAQTFLEQGLTLAQGIDDRSAIAYAQCGMGAIAQARRAYARASELYHEGWENFRQAGTAWEMANAQFNLGTLNFRAGNYFDARANFIAGLAAFRQIGDNRRTAQALSQLGATAYTRQEYTEARYWLEEALALWRGLYEKSGMAHQLDLLGYVALREGRAARAREYFIESLALFQELNQRRNLADVLCGIAGVAAAQNKSERAAVLLGAVDALRQAPGALTDTVSRVEADRDWIVGRAALDDETLKAKFTLGRAMSLEQAIEFAIQGE